MFRIMFLRYAVVKVEQVSFGLFLGYLPFQTLETNALIFKSGG